MQLYKVISVGLVLSIGTLIMTLGASMGDEKPQCGSTDRVDINGLSLTSVECATSAAQASSDIDGRYFNDCEDCPTMVVLPKFSGRHYAIGAYEITVDEWQACANAKKCRRKGYHIVLEASQPASDISFQDAVDYTRWLSKKTGLKYKIPNDKEWIYAASAGGLEPVIFQEEGGADKANFRASENGNSRVVGAYTPNAFGVYDARGNLSEWIGSCRTSEDTYDQSRECLVRGGNFASGASELNLTTRQGLPTTFNSARIGFRVIRRLDAD